MQIRRNSGPDYQITIKTIKIVGAAPKHGFYLRTQGSCSMLKVEKRIVSTSKQL